MCRCSQFFAREIPNVFLSFQQYASISKYQISNTNQISIRYKLDLNEISNIQLTPRYHPRLVRSLEESSLHLPEQGIDQFNLITIDNKDRSNVRLV